MRLVDRVAQSRALFVVRSSAGVQTRLSGATEYAHEIASCPIRYVLSDELTRLCAALAYSKGAHTLCYTDLIRIPAESLWVEWAYAPWRNELDRSGFPPSEAELGNCGRRGALFTATRDGRCGRVRTFWCTNESGLDVFASSLFADFDFDGLKCNDKLAHSDSIEVPDGHFDANSVLRTCFSFEFESSWGKYYDRAHLSTLERKTIELHSLGTIALDIPVLLAFFLLLNTRAGLPQQRSQLDRLNRSRKREGKSPLLDHIDVLAPFPSAYFSPRSDASSSGRRGPRLHHVRGHIVRRRNELFWRVPHLRGNARDGVLKSRTVTWAFDQR
jgi:hypothetical protein